MGGCREFGEKVLNHHTCPIPSVYPIILENYLLYLILELKNSLDG